MLDARKFLIADAKDVPRALVEVMHDLTRKKYI